VLLTLGSFLVGPTAGAPEGLSLGGLYAGGLAWSGAFLVFVAALYRDLRSRPDETTGLLASVGLAGGVVNAAAILPFLVLASWAVFEARSGADPGFVQSVLDAGALANNFTGFATAVCLGGFAPALHRIGRPRWLLALGAAVAAHHLASAAALAPAGPWSPRGAVSMTAPLGMTLWVGCVAVLAWRRRDRA
jgi:hypothetical protein